MPTKIRKRMQTIAQLKNAGGGNKTQYEAHQASVQELQSFRHSLNQAEAKTRDLEGQLENLNKVKRAPVSVLT